jgi:hypothetical protein
MGSTADKVTGLANEAALPPPTPHVILIEQELYDAPIVFSLWTPGCYNHYRVHVSECLRDARMTEDRELKTVFHRLAVWWIVLAHEIENDPDAQR